MCVLIADSLTRCVTDCRFDGSELMERTLQLSSRGTRDLLSFSTAIGLCADARQIPRSSG